jgi:hypothetical protein
MMDEVPDLAVNREFWQGARVAVGRAVMAGIGLFGLFAAGDAGDSVGYACGIGAFIVACLVLFLEIKRHFDGQPPLSWRDLVIDDFDTLLLGLPALVVFGVACLFFAAAETGGAGYYAGFGGAVGAALMVLFSIGACFDRAEGH